MSNTLTCGRNKFLCAVHSSPSAGLSVSQGPEGSKENLKITSENGSLETVSKDSMSKSPFSERLELFYISLLMKIGGLKYNSDLR